MTPKNPRPRCRTTSTGRSGGRLTDGHGYTIRRQSENNGRTYFYSASRIGDRIVRSSLPYTVSLSQVLNADRNFLWFMGSVTLLLCLVGYYVVRQFTKNMVQMEATLAERDREHAAALHEEQEKSASSGN